MWYAELARGDMVRVYAIELIRNLDRCYANEAKMTNLPLSEDISGPQYYS
jgi:hypothetical protein